MNEIELLNNIKTLLEMILYTELFYIGFKTIKNNIRKGRFK